MDAVVALRRMNANDIDSVCSIEQRVFPSPWSRESFAEEMRNHLAVYMVAESADRVIGYIGAWHVLDEGHITNLAVEAEWRRQGVGARLLDAMETQLYRDGVRRVTLEVRVSNTPALKLYHHRGYRERGVRRRYYQDNGEDAYIMWKHMEGEIR
jgi:ribosomal-protein-alanine N-acetyltransferase